jgi:hypothetical protein
LKSLNFPKYKFNLFHISPHYYYTYNFNINQKQLIIPPNKKLSLHLIL